MAPRPADAYSQTLLRIYGRVQQRLDENKTEMLTSLESIRHEITERLEMQHADETCRAKDIENSVRSVEESLDYLWESVDGMEQEMKDMNKRWEWIGEVLTDLHISVLRSHYDNLEFINHAARYSNGSARERLDELHPLQVALVEPHELRHKTSVIFKTSEYFPRSVQELLMLRSDATRLSQLLIFYNLRVPNPRRDSTRSCNYIMGNGYYCSYDESAWVDLQQISQVLAHQNNCFRVFVRFVGVKMKVIEALVSELA